MVTFRCGRADPEGYRVRDTTAVSTGPRRVRMVSPLPLLEESVSEALETCADAVRPNRPLGSVVTVMTGAAPPAGMGAVVLQTAGRMICYSGGF